MTRGKLPRANLEQKILILQHYHDSKRPQSETVEYFKDQFSISTSSFSEWLKHEADLRQRFEEATSTDLATSKSLMSSKRKQNFRYENINKAMHKAVEERLQQNLPVNEPILREFWVKYARIYGVEDPKRLETFSHGWLSTFKKRHGLDKKTMHANKRRRLSEESSGSINIPGNRSNANDKTDNRAVNINDDTNSNISPTPEFTYHSSPPNYEIPLPQAAFSNARQQQQQKSSLTHINAQQKENEYSLIASANGANNATAQGNQQQQQQQQRQPQSQVQQQSQSASNSHQRQPHGDRYQSYDVNQLLNSAETNSRATANQYQRLATGSNASHQQDPTASSQPSNQFVNMPSVISNALPHAHTQTVDETTNPFNVQLSAYLPAENQVNRLSAGSNNPGNTNSSRNANNANTGTVSTSQQLHLIHHQQQQMEQQQHQQQFLVDITDMEKFIFVYAERFFSQFQISNSNGGGNNGSNASSYSSFGKSKELFELFKNKFMEEKLVYGVGMGGKVGSGVDDLFLRRMR